MTSARELLPQGSEFGCCAFVFAVRLTSMSDLSVRPATADDLNFLEDMLVAAANAPDKARTREETLADPSIARYLEDWPRTTDIGVVAENAYVRPVGAAWLRLFNEAEPGYGFVRPGIPELVIGVSASYRGHGVGRTLLRALADVAWHRGHHHISLSVERANPAASLYRAEGYRVVSTRDHADTMLLDLS